MRRAHGGAALIAGGLAAVVAAPAIAATVVVGYLPPSVDYGLVDGGEDGHPLAADEIRAQGVVVNNLEPGAGRADTHDACPSEGCDYQLVVIDPAALRDAAEGEGAVGCDSLAYGVVDADPEQTALGSGGRLYTGQGALPTHTADTASAATPAGLTPGVGQLCFANPTHESGLVNDAGDGPLAATQPTPVVILSAGEAHSDRSSD